MSFWNAVGNGVRNAVMRLLRINPAPAQQSIIIQEPLSFEANVLRNRLWYRGDPSELDQFYKQLATATGDSVAKSRFWAAVPSADLQIRKIHSGLPALIVDRITDIVISDFDGIELETEELQKLWDEISEDNRFPEILGESVTETLIAGDGAFKFVVDPDVSDYPIIEFYSGERVKYNMVRGRLQEVVFLSEYTYRDKAYRLEEMYGRGYIYTRLYNEDGKEVPLGTVPETANLVPEVTYAGKFIMAVPLRFFKSPKWSDRGKSLFDNKTDSFDALDEVISQWIDAIRAGRVQKYIPEDLVPRDPRTGATLRPNPFDNQFIAIGTPMKEEDRGKIDVVQPDIAYEAFVESYANALDMCLQGIISPATLGIDLKKTDNAEAQREKEKATLYTRSKIIDVLNEVIPRLVDVALKVQDTMQKRVPGEYAASVKFGEYASPDFGTIVEIVGKARSFGIMSIEQAVEELYGDTWTDEEKKEEINRLKKELGYIELDEPAINQDVQQGDPQQDVDLPEGDD